MLVTYTNVYFLRHPRPSVPFSRTRRRVPRVPSICMRDLENVSPFLGGGQLAYLPYPTSLNPTEMRSLYENACFHEKRIKCQSHMQTGGTRGTLVRASAPSKSKKWKILLRTARSSQKYSFDFLSGATSQTEQPSNHVCMTDTPIKVELGGHLDNERQGWRKEAAPMKSEPPCENSGTWIFTGSRKGKGAV